MTLSTSDGTFLAVTGLAHKTKHCKPPVLSVIPPINALPVCAHSVVKFALVMYTAIRQCSMSLAKYRCRGDTQYRASWL